MINGTPRDVLVSIEHFIDSDLRLNQPHLGAFIGAAPSDPETNPAYATFGVKRDGKGQLGWINVHMIPDGKSEMLVQWQEPNFGMMDLWSLIEEKLHQQGFIDWDARNSAGRGQGKNNVPSDQFNTAWLERNSHRFLVQLCKETNYNTDLMVDLRLMAKKLSLNEKQVIIVAERLESQKQLNIESPGFVGAVSITEDGIKIIIDEINKHLKTNPPTIKQIAEWQRRSYQRDYKGGESANNLKEVAPADGVGFTLPTSNEEFRSILFATHNEWVNRYGDTFPYKRETNLVFYGGYQQEEKLYGAFQHDIQAYLAGQNKQGHYVGDYINHLPVVIWIVVPVSFGKEIFVKLEPIHYAFLVYADYVLQHIFSVWPDKEIKVSDQPASPSIFRANKNDDPLVKNRARAFRENELSWIGGDLEKELIGYGRYLWLKEKSLGILNHLCNTANYTTNTFVHLQSLTAHFELRLEELLAIENYLAAKGYISRKHYGLIAGSFLITQSGIDRVREWQTNDGFTSQSIQPTNKVQKQRVGRPRNKDDDWAWIQINRKGRKRKEVYEEWIERIGERADILTDKRDSFNKAVSPKRGQGKKLEEIE